MSIYGSTLLRRRLSKELTQLASPDKITSGAWKSSLLHAGRMSCTRSGYVEHRNPEQRSGSCEFPPLSCHLSSSKGREQGREEPCPHCWGTLLSQALCLNRTNVLATVSLPMASHPHMGRQLLDMTLWTPVVGTWVWARAAPQLLVGAAVGAAAAPCILAHAPCRWGRLQLVPPPCYIILRLSVCLGFGNPNLFVDALEEKSHWGTSSQCHSHKLNPTRHGPRQGAICNVLQPSTFAKAGKMLSSLRTDFRKVIC